MDLENIRAEIDKIDKDMLALFTRRMALAGEVADYKKQNGMQIFQASREEQVLDRITSLSDDEFKKASRLLFANIMDISKCLQIDRLTQADKPVIYKNPTKNPRVACQGTHGSYSHYAFDAFFENGEVSFYKTFEEVFTAVENDNVDYGILPIENNTAGDVSQTYELMSRHDFYIFKSVAIPVRHVLAGKKGAKLENIKRVYSHEQALRQCAGFLESNPDIQAVHYLNTASAAKMVSESDDTDIGAICSVESAKLYGLDILAEKIANSDENYTRFICISKCLEVEENADTISVALSTPHTSGALYRLLTRFAVNGLNLTKIENKPLPENIRKEHEFDVVFYLDFTGNIEDMAVVRMLENLKDEMKFYKFLGNYKSLIIK